MKNGLLYGFLFIFIIFLYFSPFSYAQTRYAECDACGYCIGKTAPESWVDCRSCLYPNITAEADQNKTLEIITTPIVDPNNSNKVIVNVPVPPEKGRYYTQLGCVDTSLSSFSDPGAVGGVLNFILTKLIFPSTGVLAFGALIYGAFLLVTAQGAEMQMARGKRYITGSIVGLVFTFSVVLIVNIVGEDVLRIPGFGSGTKVTFVGYGTSTTENSVVTFPSVVIQYDGRDIDTIKSLEGSASQPQEYTIYLPTKINLTNQNEVRKVTLLFNNDLCIDCRPHHSTHFGDRNIYNTRILFDDKPCTQRILLDESGTTIAGPLVDGEILYNYWPDKTIKCLSL